MGVKLGNVQINDRFREALELMEGGAGNVFVTGKAGTGKSTLLDYFRDITQKKIAVLAPTGVAAVNVCGQTIHSFFGFRPDITPDQAKKIARRALKWGEAKIYQELDAVVIDEISMVRADLLDSVDAFLRAARKKPRTPFGGLRMILIGDLCQLPPVVTSRERMIFEEHYRSPYFFDSRVFPLMQIQTVELETVYRQNDERFIELLNAVRNSTLTGEQIDLLNSRFDPEFHPAEEFSVLLTATNDRAAAVNAQRLAGLRTVERIYEGVMEGEVDPKMLPTGTILGLKEGAQVMLLNNDSRGRWVNGTMGIVVGLPKESEDPIIVELESGRDEEVSPYQWEIFRYGFDAEKEELRTETVGTFTQYPLRLAWAITIHKSQGKTFNRMVIDAGRGMFAPGQMYVALSRCRSLNGIVLTRPLDARQAFVDRRVTTFLAGDRFALTPR